MASNRTVCPACKGSRKVMGMGGITTPDCETCDGLGYLIKTTQVELDKKLEEVEKSAEAEVKEKTDKSVQAASVRPPRKLKRKE